MARARNIKPGFFTNDVLAECSSLARILFQGLWCHADREGRLEDRPRKLKAEILPYDECDIEELLRQLECRGFIVRYRHGSNRFIQVVNFCKHQNPHVKESESAIPAPCMNGANTEQAEKEPERAGLIPDSLNPITDSLNPITDSLNPITDSLNPITEEKQTAQKTRLVGVSEVFEFWKSSMGHDRAKLDSKRSKQIADALKLGYTLEDLKNAIIGCTLSSYHMGDNDKGAKYDSLSLILRDAGKIDQFIGYFNSPPVKQSSQPAKTQYQINQEATTRALFGSMLPSARNDSMRTIEGEVMP